VISSSGGIGLFWDINDTLTFGELIRCCRCRIESIIGGKGGKGGDYDYGKGGKGKGKGGKGGDDDNDMGGDDSYRF
jgi:hypothetical protein